MMRRRDQPSEITHALFFLASHQASYSTAATRHVDGGLVHHED